MGFAITAPIRFTRDDALALVDAHARLRAVNSELAAEVDELFQQHSDILDRAVIDGELRMSAGVAALIRMLQDAVEQRLEMLA